VLGNDTAFPEQVDEVGFALEVLDRFIETGDLAAADAEDVEEFIPEGLGFGALTRGVGPRPGEEDGLVLDFVPREGHAGEYRTRVFGKSKLA